ncbi:DNA-binding protein [Actinomadura sp. DC4]|uniref:DNA-binding protein n=1 Tax=Actinomadura sp. DC4 TaxID=3055069 RepID=UPI0025B0317E|nr:DNA-binding protein [Actinomadura sp. DC4]MDN3353088.1 DNA-binding protein [Actinomadura sp. DC4]
MIDAFSGTPADPRHRYAALLRLTERHARGESRERWENSQIPMGPLDAVRQVALVAGGGQVPVDGEPNADADDIAAALALVHLARTEVDETEIGLLEMARGRGMTWQQIGFHMGLGSAQAARQRHQRLAARTEN